MRMSGADMASVVMIFNGAEVAGTAKRWFWGCGKALCFLACLGTCLQKQCTSCCSINQFSAERNQWEWSRTRCFTIDSQKTTRQRSLRIKPHCLSSKCLCWKNVDGTLYKCAHSVLCFGDTSVLPIINSSARNAMAPRAASDPCRPRQTKLRALNGMRPASLVRAASGSSRLFFCRLRSQSCLRRRKLVSERKQSERRRSGRSYVTERWRVWMQAFLLATVPFPCCALHVKFCSGRVGAAAAQIRSELSAVRPFIRPFTAKRAFLNSCGFFLTSFVAWWPRPRDFPSTNQAQWHKRTLFANLEAKHRLLFMIAPDVPM